MTSIKYIRILTFAALACAIALVSACTKEEAAEPILTVPEKTTLESFGPTGALHGDTLSLIGYHLDRVTQVDLTGATVPAASFISKSAELINFIIPTETVQGYITLKSSDGDIVSKTILNLEVMPTITSVTAEALPGSNISIKGNHLNWVTSVTFAKGLVVTTFVSQSISEIVVKVPDNAESGKLLINYAGTDPGEFETTNSLVVTLPVASSFTPNPVKHQTNVTITGTNLDFVKKIAFASVATPVTSFVSQSATQIVVNVPSATTKGKVTLYPASDVPSVSVDDLDVLLPAITGMAPNPVKPLDNLTITGTNLNLTTAVSFVGIPSPITTFVSQSATQIIVKVPEGTLKGKITLSVLNSSLTIESSEVLDLIGGLPPLADFPYAIYTDGFMNGFQDWSWAARVTNSTANVRQGTYSIKATYGGGGYEGITFHHTAASTTGYTKFEFSLFGEPGTDGKKMNVVTNGGWGSPYVVTIVGGEWTTYSVSLSNMGSPAIITDIVLQSAGFSGVVHIDHVGLR